MNFSIVTLNYLTNIVNIKDVKTRYFIQRPDGKNLEIDVVAESTDEAVLLIEVKKRKEKIGIKDIETFQEKIEIYKDLNPEKIVFTGFLSLGGFTDEALKICKQNTIGWAEEFSYF